MQRAEQRLNQPDQGEHGLVAPFQTILGGNISIYTELCEKARADAFKYCMQHAEAHGANAVVGIRYDATEVMRGVTEVLCYGTAVQVEEDGQTAGGTDRAGTG